MLCVGKWSRTTPSTGLAESAAAEVLEETALNTGTFLEAGMAGAPWRWLRTAGRSVSMQQTGILVASGQPSGRRFAELSGTAST